MPEYPMPNLRGAQRHKPLILAPSAGSRPSAIFAAAAPAPVWMSRRLGRPVVRVRKQIATAGRWAHRGTGRTIDIPRSRLATWDRETRALIAAGVHPYVPNRHRFDIDPADPRHLDAGENFGRVVDTQLIGDRWFATVELIGNRALDAMAANDVSICIVDGQLDARGRRYGEALQHLAIVPDPVLPNLAPAQQVRASSLSFAPNAASAIALAAGVSGRFKLALGYDPNQPRDFHGRWANVGDSGDAGGPDAASAVIPTRSRAMTWGNKRPLRDEAVEFELYRQVAARAHGPVTPTDVEEERRRQADPLPNKRLKDVSPAYDWREWARRNGEIKPAVAGRQSTQEQLFPGLREALWRDHNKDYTSLTSDPKLIEKWEEWIRQEDLRAHPPSLAARLNDMFGIPTGQTGALNINDVLGALAGFANAHVMPGEGDAGGRKSFQFDTAELVEVSPPRSAGVVDRVGESELGNALSGLGRNPLGRNINTLEEFGPGAGFSGVFDVESGKWLAYPSGKTRLLNGATPLNVVDQYGGHGPVDQVLHELLGSTSNNRLGFSMTLDEAGNLKMGWNSRTINAQNPNLSDRTVPENMRQRVLDAISQSTGRKAYTP